MSREMKRKGKSGKGAVDRQAAEVKLAAVLEILQGHLTEALCEEVFADTRRDEREREWTLYALAQFWTAVVLEAPPALKHLLRRMRGGELPGILPAVTASDQAFYERSKELSREFFASLYVRFLQSVLADAPRGYGAEFSSLRERFATVVIMDGSRLEKIAHRLKILRREKAAVLPGCLLAVYDLFLGVAVQLRFDADAAAAEHPRAVEAIADLAPRTLVLGDRLYSSLQMFAALEAEGCFGVFRRNGTLSLKRLECLRSIRSDERTLEDWRVTAGRGAAARELRLIILREGDETYEALTNVLDPERLSAEEIAALYPQRWKVERLFLELKEVLNLHRLYPANPNAIAMQVYAAAMVHTSFRLAQASIARTHAVPTEEISSQKLFPHLACVCVLLMQAEIVYEHTCRANPGVRLRKPSWKDLPGTSVPLKDLLVQRRSPKRRRPKFHKDRAKWKSIAAVKGGKRLIR